MRLEPEEGDFYGWAYAELAKLLSETQLSELAAAFTLTEAGNFEGKNVLQRTESGVLSESIETALDKLFRLRYGAFEHDTPLFEPAVDAQMAKGKIWPGRRIPPVTDTKMIVAWNALMISGLAKAAVAFQRKDYLVLAIETAGYIQQYQQVGDTLYRLNYDGEVAVAAQAEDYALLIKALLDIQQACLSFADYVPMAADWLESAIALQTQFDDENLDYFTQAEKTLQAFSTVIEKAPRACPSLLSGLDWFIHPTLIRTSAEQLDYLSQQRLPTAVVRAEDSLPSGTVGLVCKGLSCQQPATSIDMMLTQIKQSQKFG